MVKTTPKKSAKKKTVKKKKKSVKKKKPVKKKSDKFTQLELKELDEASKIDSLIVRPPMSARRPQTGDYYKVVCEDCGKFFHIFMNQKHKYSCDRCSMKARK